MRRRFNGLWLRLALEGASHAENQKLSKLSLLSEAMKRPDGEMRELLEMGPARDGNAATGKNRNSRRQLRSIPRNNRLSSFGRAGAFPFLALELGHAQDLLGLDRSLLSEHHRLPAAARSPVPQVHRH
jgi:hypothetical protein